MEGMEGMAGTCRELVRAERAEEGQVRASENLRATIAVLDSGIVTSRAPKRSLRGADRAIIGL